MSHSLSALQVLARDDVIYLPERKSVFVFMRNRRKAVRMTFFQYVPSVHNDISVKQGGFFLSNFAQILISYFHGKPTKNICYDYQPQPPKTAIVTSLDDSEPTSLKLKFYLHFRPDFSCNIGGKHSVAKLQFSFPIKLSFILSLPLWFPIMLFITGAREASLVVWLHKGLGKVSATAALQNDAASTNLH